MSISAGFTAAEIRSFVFRYEAVPHGQKAIWLSEQGVSADRLRRWRSAVFDGDLDRGLIPRQGRSVATSARRDGRDRLRAAEHAAQEAELARLTARVQELEQVNETLGKAIGLLHQLNEHEPDATLVSDPPDSLPPKTPSSSS